eukprot:GEMP01024829.1.p1 GENE.GEMP01024829.1~~GEMP01024829.1.p1  ORF type:complete len:536 (+),score=83.64 GEMP01024829.1:89-1609(+)
MCVSKGVLRYPRITIETFSLHKWVIESSMLQYDISSSGVVNIQIIPTNDAVSQIVQGHCHQRQDDELHEKDGIPTPSKDDDKRATRSSASSSSSDIGLPASAKIDLSEEFVQKNLVGNFRDYYSFRNNGEEDPRIKCMARRFPETTLRALDVGCNDGTIARGLAYWFSKCKFVGVDIDPFLIASAPETCENVELKIRDVAEDGIPSGEWDVILFLSIARWIHLQRGDDRLKTILRSFGTQIPPGGLLVMESARWESYKHCIDSLKAAGRHAPDIEFYPNHFSDFLTAECGFIYQRDDTWQEYPEYGDSTASFFRHRPLEYYYKGNNCPVDGRIMGYDRGKEKQQCGWCSACEPSYVCPLCDYRMCTSCFELPRVQRSKADSVISSGTPEPSEESEKFKGSTSQAKTELPKDDLEQELPSPESPRLLIGQTYVTLAAFTQSLVPEGDDAEDYLMFQAGEIVELHKKDLYGWVLGTKISDDRSTKDSTPKLGWLPFTFVKATSAAALA